MVLWIFDNIPLLLEVVAVVCGLVYVILAAHNSIWCWLFGIVGSCLSIILFYKYYNLVAESMLYIYYVATGIYGWVNWKKAEQEKSITSKPIKTHLILISSGLAATYLLSLFIQKVFADASYPLLDSFTTIFSIITTILVVQKWIENWLYWIVINTLTVFLYFAKGLDFYGSLTIVYVGMSIYGYFNWRKLKWA